MYDIDRHFMKMNIITVCNIVLLVVAVILLDWRLQQPMLFALLVVPLAYAWLKFRHKSQSDVPETFKRFESIEMVVSVLGQPDDSILLNATRANELAGNILVYRDRKLMIIDGTEVNMDDIVDVATVNTATPYTLGDYQVVLTMRKPRKDYIRLPIGQDADYAMQVAKDIIDQLRSASASFH